jgi:two-component system KDP operon response regulator KdpE
MSGLHEISANSECLVMSRAARILLVDDSPILQHNLALLLSRRGYDVESVTTPPAADEALIRQCPDLMVLDLNRPDCDAGAVCAHVRQSFTVPIIVLSTRSGDEDSVATLDQGADDVISKPFSVDVFLARVRVALRRALNVSVTARLDRTGLVMDLERRRVVMGTNEVRLTPKEFELLVCLARHPNAVVPHRAILAAIWGNRAASRPQQLWALVTKVRKKIEPNPDEPRYLLCEPWVGYRLANQAVLDR